MKYEIGDVVKIKNLVSVEDYSEEQLSWPIIKTKRWDYRKLTTQTWIILWHCVRSNWIMTYSIRIHDSETVTGISAYNLFWPHWNIVWTWNQTDNYITQKQFQLMFKGPILHCRNPNIINNYIPWNITAAKKFWIDSWNPDLKFIDKKIWTRDSQLFKEINEPAKPKVVKTKTTTKKVVKKSTE